MRNGAVIALSITSVGAEIAVRGDLDMNSTPLAYQRVILMMREQRQLGRRSFVVDLSNVRFCDSAGIGMLQTVQLVARRARADFEFRGLTALPERLREFLVTDEREDHR